MTMRLTGSIVIVVITCGIVTVRLAHGIVIVMIKGSIGILRIKNGIGMLRHTRGTVIVWIKIKKKKTEHTGEGTDRYTVILGTVRERPFPHIPENKKKDHNAGT